MKPLRSTNPSQPPDSSSKAAPAPQVVGHTGKYWDALRAAGISVGSPPDGMKSGLVISVSGKDEDEDRGRRPPRGWDREKEAAKFRDTSTKP